MKFHLTVVPSIRIGRHDVIVIECPGPVLAVDQRALEHACKKLWPQNRCLVLTDGATLKIGIDTRRARR